MIGKSTNSSAVGASAYRSGSLLVQTVIGGESGQEGLHDYRKKVGVVFSKIYAPEGLSSWCYDRQELWNKVEHSEKRVNSQFAREMDMALQTEFTLEQNIQIISEFVQENFIAGGMIADVNFHYDNPSNPHAHIMLTTRELLFDDNGVSIFGKKVRSWGDKSWLLHLRKSWADINNKYFKIHDIDKTITHESYAARGIDIDSTSHKGLDKHTSISLGRVDRNNKIINDNLEFIQNNPLSIISSLANNKAIFSSDDIHKELNNFLQEMAKADAELPPISEEQFAELFSKLKDNLVKLCDKDLRGNELFTTQEQLSLEKGFLSNLNRLKNQNNHSFHLDCSALQINEEKQKAIAAVAGGGDISLLIGRPGTGKSTVVSALAKEYKARGYRVLGAAYSAAAAINLKDAAKIPAYTLSKWQYDWESQRDSALPRLNNKDVFIIDEMSMVDLKMMDYMLKEVREVGCKLILIGDDNQFSAIGMGGATCKLVEALPNITLSEVYRQRDALDKEVTNKLADYKVDEAILLLKSNNKFIFGSNPKETRSKIIDDYLELIKNNMDVAIIAHSNDKVRALNKELRVRLLDAGLLQSKHYSSAGKVINGKAIAIGERLVLTKNDKRLGVTNGQLAIVTKIRDGAIDIEVQGKEITINTNQYPHFDYGYAITAYKSQGKTYSHSLLLVDENVGYEAFNVMATRHKNHSKIYVEESNLRAMITKRYGKANDKTIDRNLDSALYELLVRRDYSGFAHDYLDFDEVPEVAVLKEYIQHRDAAFTIYKRIMNYEDLWDQFKIHKERRMVLAKTIVEGFESFRKYISGSDIQYSTLLRHAGMEKIRFTSEIKVNPRYNAAIKSGSVIQAQGLIEVHESSLEQLQKLKLEIKQLEKEKWQVDNQLKINQNLQQDFKLYLHRVFKDDADKVIAKWESGKPLGELVGIGIGKHVAISGKRAEAISHLHTLQSRFEVYASNKAEVKECIAAAALLADNKEVLLKEYEALEVNSLSKRQVTRLLTIINKPLQQKMQVSQEELYDRLASGLEEFAPALMEKITGKKVERQHNFLKSGSMHLSLSESRGLWYRFSTGRGGNLFDLIKEAGGDSKEYMSDYSTPKPVKAKEACEVLAAPADAKQFDAKKDLYFKFKGGAVLEDVYEYRNIHNQLYGYVIRIQKSDGKEIAPVIYIKDKGWRARGFGDVRPLYNEHLLADKPVLIVEGEKTANAASELYPEFTVVTWNGGASSYKKSNWSVMQGREVVIWPDNDQAGVNAAAGIKEFLPEAKIIDPAQLELPEKWDLADKLPDGVYAYHITDLLFRKSTAIKPDRVISEYAEVRNKQLEYELHHAKDLGEYMVMQDRNKTLIGIESKLLGSVIKSGEALNVVAEIELRHQASEIYDKEHGSGVNLSRSLAKIYPDIHKSQISAAINLAGHCAKEIVGSDAQNHALAMVVAKQILDHPAAHEMGNPKAMAQIKADVMQRVQITAKAFEQQKQGQLEINC